MIRKYGILICLIIIFIVCLVSCGGQKNAASEEQKNGSAIDKQERETATDQPKQTSGNVGVIKCGDGLAFDISFGEFVKTWNGLCSDDNRLPSKDNWESYTTDRAIHYNSPANNYLYAPGDNDALYPMLHIYTSEKDDKVVQIELSYDDHSMQEYTYNIYEEMCVNSLKCIMRSENTSELSKICSKVNAAGSENVVQYDQEYGESAIPPQLFHMDKVGLYLYYEIGSRMHFCIIPVDQQNLSEFQKAGAEIEKIHLNMANIITGIRIICSVALLLCSVFSPEFYTLYIIAGVSDMIDGEVARKTGTVSEFGSKFDTAADFVFVIVCLIKLIPAIHVPTWLIVWIIVIAMIKVINLISGYVMRKELVSLHTAMNKAAGILLFVLPLTITFIDLKYSGTFVSAVATFAAIQEGHLIRTGLIKSQIWQ